MKTTMRNNERGFSLIIGMSVLILLTVLGIAVVQGINADVDSAASDRGSQSALAIAEAGLTWSLDYLKRSYGLDTATAQTFTNIVGNTNSDLSNYADCSTEEKSAVDADASPVAANWKCVTKNRAAAEKTFGGGRYHVWVAKDPADPTQKTLLVRSLGIDARGSQRLVEIAVTAGAGQTL